jgi:outer membrane protein assembly factor BamB
VPRLPTLAALAAALALAACGPRERPLEGERLDLRALGTPAVDAPLDASAAAEAAAVPAGAPPRRSPDAPENRALPISLPAPVVNEEWTHRNGGPAHRGPHAALSAAPQRIWAVPIGAGNSRRGRITADPVVAGGRIFTLDAAATVSAVSTAGQILWQRDLTPASDRAEDASGGGLAYGGGRLFVTSGFGSLTALDPATGALLWTQRLDAAATGAPAVAGDLVYVTARDSRAWAVRADTGRIAWQLEATPSPSGLLAGAGPAVTDRMVILPFGSGELVAALRDGGARVWGAAVAGQRRGRAYATIADISGDPVVDGRVVFVGNQSGRAAAFDLASGERLWTAAEGAYAPVWPEGGSAFLISDQAELVRLDAATGGRIWGVELPYWDTERERRRRAVWAHYGPVLAGGRLWVASGDGFLRAFAPQDGQLLAEIPLPGGAASAPAVAGGTLYVLSANGQLQAFR